MIKKNLKKITLTFVIAAAPQYSTSAHAAADAVCSSVSPQQRHFAQTRLQCVENQKIASRARLPLVSASACNQPLWKKEKHKWA